MTQSRRRTALSQALAARRDVTVDLTGLRFADPSLMIDLAMVARRLRMRGFGLRLCGAHPDIHRLIAYVGLDRLAGVVIEATMPDPGPAAA